jgi:hypothetical protein
MLGRTMEKVYRKRAEAGVDQGRTHGGRDFQGRRAMTLAVRVGPWLICTADRGCVIALTWCLVCGA